MDEYLHILYTNQQLEVSPWTPLDYFKTDTLSAKDMFSTVHDGTEKHPESPCSPAELGLFCFLAPLPHN